MRLELLTGFPSEIVNIEVDTPRTNIETPSDPSKLSAGISFDIVGSQLQHSTFGSGTEGQPFQLLITGID